MNKYVLTYHRPSHHVCDPCEHLPVPSRFRTFPFCSILSRSRRSPRQTEVSRIRACRRGHGQDRTHMQGVCDVRQYLPVPVPPPAHPHLSSPVYPPVATCSRAPACEPRRRDPPQVTFASGSESESSEHRGHVVNGSSSPAKARWDAAGADDGRISRKTTSIESRARARTWATVTDIGA